jgi:hypothetical protein
MHKRIRTYLYFFFGSPAAAALALVVPGARGRGVFATVSDISDLPIVVRPPRPSFGL